MNNKGSVTVYIVLIFSVLIILVTSVISILRYEYEKMNSITSLNISQEAAFGKYFRPLLDEYGMYYYISNNGEDIKADIMSYVAKNQSGISKMLSFEPAGLDITNMYYATDNEADNVRRQMCAVIKDTFVQEEINKMLENYNMPNLSDNNKELNKCKLKAQEDVNEAKQEIKMLELLKLVEGITVSGGSIECGKEYAKCALNGDVTAQNAGIDNPGVWKAVKDNSYDMTEYLVKLKKNARKAIKGKKVNYSVAKTTRWCNRLKKVYEVTKRAKDAAGEMQKVKNGICNPKVIEKALTVNVSILETLLHLQDIKRPENSDDWQHIYSITSEYIELLNGYHVKDIVFDYSTLNLKKADNPAKKTDGDVSDMITFLLGDTRRISNKSVSAVGLYENLPQDKTKKISDIDFENIDELTGTIDNCIADETKSDTVNSLYIQLYIDRFFSEFDCCKEKSDCVNKLDYEKEYIINAGASDRDNLKAVTYRILMLRMGTSYVYLVSDSVSRQKAYAAAAAVVGFTGLDAVVRCVSQLILVAWAYQDACVDTGAVLSGKKISPVKNHLNLNIKFEELMLFSKENLSNKINKISGKKGLSYDNYLDFFMLIISEKKRVFRSMDLIQYNMKKNYDSLFTFQKAVYGVDTRLICEKPYYYAAKGRYRYK